MTAELLGKKARKTIKSQNQVDLHLLLFSYNQDFFHIQAPPQRTFIEHQRYGTLNLLRISEI